MKSHRIILIIKHIVGIASIKLCEAMSKLKESGFWGRLIYGVYRFGLHLFDFADMPVVNATVYKEKTGNVTCNILSTNRIGVTGIIVTARAGESMMLKEMPLPDLKLLEYKNVCIRGNSDVVVDVDNGYVISEVSYNLQPNEEVVDGLLYRTRNNVCLLRDNLCHPRINVKCGIMVSGKFCNNYYHIMYENLIRLVFLDKLDLPNDVPLIVDAKTMSIPSCKRIFDILVGGQRRNVILINEKALYQFNSLYCISRINSIPAHSVNPRLNVQILYDPEVLSLMRNKLLSFRSKRTFPKRLFVTRKNGGKRHYNEGEVFQVLKNKGFEEVAPELFSFEEQMAMFNEAEFIVSGSGATLTNLLFVSSKCTVICFGRGSYADPHNSPIFNTIAIINGARFVYFPRKRSIKNELHVDYEINCIDFSDWISSVIM